MKYLLFFLIFLYTANWGHIHYIVRNLLVKKDKPKNVQDKFVQDVLLKKAGLKIPYVKLFPPAIFYGVMPSNPPMKPIMVLSEQAYKDFNKDEMEWLVLHEAGHYVLWHGVKSILVQVVIFIFGIVILSYIPSWILIVAVILGIIGGIMYIQYTHYRERQANLFAVHKMDNPLGMKTAAEKMMKRYANEGINEKTLFARFFFIWNYYVRVQQIADCENETVKRKAQK